MNYKVKITESRYKTVEVDAINENEAKIIVSNQYRLKEIELKDGVDIGDVTIAVCNPEYELPMFKETMDSLDRLTIVK